MTGGGAIGWRLAARIAALAACMTWAMSAVAQIGEAPAREVKSTLPGTLDARHLTLLGLQVGANTLADVQARLGAARPFAPDPAREFNAVCYVAADGAGGTVITFQARRDDRRGLLTSADLAVRHLRASSIRYCQPLPVGLSAVNAAGAGPGMTRAAFQRTFRDPPSESSVQRLGYYYFEPIEPRNTGTGRQHRCQLLTGVRARFDTDVLTELALYAAYQGSGC